VSEQKDSTHRQRTVKRMAIDPNVPVEAAAAAGAWEPVPKREAPKITPPKLKEQPQLKTPEERINFIEKALDLAVEHMHKAEKGQVQNVEGMKTYGLSVITETLGLTPDELVNDEGALSDLNEYLISMARVTSGVDMRSQGFDPEQHTGEDIDAVLGINNTWDLHNNEFGQPLTWQRINWQGNTPGKGN